MPRQCCVNARRCRVNAASTRVIIWVEILNGRPEIIENPSAYGISNEIWLVRAVLRSNLGDL
jgi:hypothetical protein